MRPEIEHIIRVLRTAMRVFGYRNADLERKMGWSTSYLSRLFSGGIELRFEHVLDITAALGLRPDEIFRIAYPDREPPSEAALRLRQATGAFLPARSTVPASPPPHPLPSTRSDEDLERLMEKALRKFFTERSSG
ncbi:MAG TPA: helix-turn-helix transcriptional regulator [Thermoanaerobaculia bacterium]|nr:helix-turn-helix transcriptional regulator [Thermoanaerobaculia bacterium]